MAFQQDENKVFILLDGAEGTIATYKKIITGIFLNPPRRTSDGVTPTAKITDANCSTTENKKTQEAIPQSKEKCDPSDIYSSTHTEYPLTIEHAKDQNKILSSLNHWYYNNWFIGAMLIIGSFFSWFLIGIPFLIIGIIFLSKKGIKEKEIKQLNLSQYISALSHLNNIQRDIDIKEKTYSEFIEKAKTDAESEYQSILAQKQDELEEINTKINNRETIFEEYFQEAKEKTDKELQDLLGNQYHIREELIQKTKELEKINKSLKTQTNKLDKVKELYRAANYAISKYTNIDILSNEIKLPALKEEELNSLSPTVTLNLHSMDVPGLKKAFRKNDKLIEQTLKQYADRYTTKANVAIYKLMVMALRSELQNVLTNLKYDLIDKSTENIKLITAKYSKIAADGNQSIAPTLIRFIGEIEYLFLNAVKIEYEYYTKREAQKAEQAAIREQMKQEAAERKELERQKVQVEAEELKFTSVHFKNG
ncbi:hypothetical protein [Eubacterium aggregans]|uniref:hypothetical protein n=1 Tax=Eubacterium aggregans TaxID=81409 RepID=UPI003F2E5862